MSKPTVFISYSHKDEEWKDRLRPHLGTLEIAGRITIWDDRKIDPGHDWFDEIKGIMDRAAVSVCLICPPASVSMKRYPIFWNVVSAKKWNSFSY